MSVVNMLEFRFSGPFTYTRWAYNVYLLFVKEKVSVCATDANDFILLMIKRQKVSSKIRFGCWSHKISIVLFLGNLSTGSIDNIWRVIIQVTIESLE